MKNKLYLISGIAVVLVAAVFIASIGYFMGSQRKLNRGLWEACKHDNAAAASYWLAKGADVNARDTHRVVGLTGGTALHMCAHFANTQTVDLLLQLGADPNAVDNDGRTPLFSTNVASVANRLIADGADLSKTDDQGETALQSRESNGWHVDDDLRAALTGEGPATERERSEQSKDNFVTNLDNVGTARVWGIHFHVQDTRHRRTSSTFKGTVSGDPYGDHTDATNTITLGEVIILLEDRPGRPITFQLNGQSHGTLKAGDDVRIDADRNVTVNDVVRLPGGTNP